MTKHILKPVKPLQRTMERYKIDEEGKRIDPKDQKAWKLSKTWQRVKKVFKFNHTPVQYQSGKRRGTRKVA